MGVTAEPSRGSFLMRAVLLAALGILVPASPALAIHSGHVQGRIYDEKGSPIAGALVTISGSEAVGIWSCPTDETGFYRIAGLDAGRSLTVRVEADSRATLERAGYRVRDDQTLHLDFRLRPEGVFQSLVLFDGSVPYHRTALAGARGTLPPGVRVMDVRNDSPRTIRKLGRVLGTRPDGVLAIGSLAARLARQTLYDIPVVYTLVTDPATESLIVSNMCGVPSNGGFSEQLDVLSQMAPQVRKIGTLFVPERAAAVVRQLRVEAEEAGFQMEARPVHDLSLLAHEIQSLEHSGIEAFLLLLDPELWTTESFSYLRGWAQEHEILLIVPDGSMVRAGATFSYAPGFHELGAYAGRLLTNVVKRETSVAEIGVIFPTTRYFSVNPQDLDRFGLQMPASVLRLHTDAELEITLTPQK